MPKLEQGLVQIYTGNGKGKTTAALGQTVRALGQGFTVYIIQFMKGRGNYGELTTLQRLAPQCRVEHYGGPGWVKKGQGSPEDYAEAEKALARAREVMTSGEWDVVILDEVVNAIGFELLPEEKVLDLIDQKPDQVELILTGRNASATLQSRADLVTESVAVKHPYEKGIGARRGIEY